jgi:hypothetical protein
MRNDLRMMIEVLSIEKWPQDFPMVFMIHDMFVREVAKWKFVECPHSRIANNSADERINNQFYRVLHSCL